MVISTKVLFFFLIRSYLIFSVGDFYSNSVAEDYQEGAGGLRAFDPFGRR